MFLCCLFSCLVYCYLYVLHVYLYVLLRVAVRSRETWRPSWWSTVGVSRPGGPSGRRVSVVACPSPDGLSAWASAKGGRSEAAGDRRDRGGNPTAFVFVPRPGRAERSFLWCLWQGLTACQSHSVKWHCSRSGAGGAVLLSGRLVERQSDGGHFGSAGGVRQDKGVRPPLC
jgi:hypothetical protein